MSSFRNHVQLIGNIGSDITIPDLESGKKVDALFPCHQLVLPKCQGEKGSLLMDDKLNEVEKIKKQPNTKIAFRGDALIMPLSQ